jgi:hypothetical protein
MIVGKHLVLLGGREHEHYVLGRLLEHLQEGVEGLGGQHVDLVDDVDLREPADGGEVDPVPEVPYLVDPAVGGRVHLDHVKRRVVHDGPAAVAGPVRLGRRPRAQFSPIASTFAVEVFPVPRGPLKR